MDLRCLKTKLGPMTVLHVIKALWKFGGFKTTAHLRNEDRMGPEARDNNGTLYFRSLLKERIDYIMFHGMLVICTLVGTQSACFVLANYNDMLS